MVLELRTAGQTAQTAQTLYGRLISNSMNDRIIRESSGKFNSPGSAKASGTVPPPTLFIILKDYFFQMIFYY